MVRFQRKDTKLAYPQGNLLIENSYAGLASPPFLLSLKGGFAAEESRNLSWRHHVFLEIYLTNGLFSGGLYFAFA